MNQILLFGLLPEFLKNYLTQLLLSIVFCLFLREHLEALVTASVRLQVLQIVDSHKYCNSHPAYHRETPREWSQETNGSFQRLSLLYPD
jgi:hypothetical protein